MVAVRDPHRPDPTFFPYHGVPDIVGPLVEPTWSVSYTTTGALETITLKIFYASRRALNRKERLLHVIFNNVPSYDSWRHEFLLVHADIGGKCTGSRCGMVLVMPKRCITRREVHARC